MRRTSCVAMSLVWACSVGESRFDGHHHVISEPGDSAARGVIAVVPGRGTTWTNVGGFPVAIPNAGSTATVVTADMRAAVVGCDEIQWQGVWCVPAPLGSNLQYRLTRQCVIALGASSVQSICKGQPAWTDMRDPDSMSRVLGESVLCSNHRRAGTGPAYATCWNLIDGATFEVDGLVLGVTGRDVYIRSVAMGVAGVRVVDSRSLGVARLLPGATAVRSPVPDALVIRVEEDGQCIWRFIVQGETVATTRCLGAFDDYQLAADPFGNYAVSLSGELFVRSASTWIKRRQLPTAWSPESGSTSLVVSVVGLSDGISIQDEWGVLLIDD